MNVGLAITRNAVRHPDDPAVFGALPHSNASLDERTNRIANHLLGLGLQKGDRVAFLVANRPEVVEVMGGVAKAGLVYVGLNFRLIDATTSEVLYTKQVESVIKESGLMLAALGRFTTPASAQGEAASAPPSQGANAA